MAKRALCIGVDDYGPQSLEGAINDSKDWGAELEQRGFMVEMLHDERATREGIVDQMERMIVAAIAGDSLVFTYSGHGTFMADEDGDEDDRRDEVLCPFDTANNVIADDELFSICSKAAEGVKIVLLADCCHSGSISEGKPPGEGGVRIGKARFLDPAFVFTGERLERTRRLANVRPFGRSREGKALLIAACRDDQEADEIAVSGRSNGAFTRVALNLLRSHEPETYAAWHALLRPELDELGLAQEPQLVGSSDQQAWRVFD